MTSKTENPADGVIIVRMMESTLPDNLPMDTPLRLRLRDRDELVPGQWSVYVDGTGKDYWSVSRNGGETYYGELPPLGQEITWKLFSKST